MVCFTSRALARSPTKMSQPSTEVSHPRLDRVKPSIDLVVDSFFRVNLTSLEASHGVFNHTIMFAVVILASLPSNSV